MREATWRSISRLLTIEPNHDKCAIDSIDREERVLKSKFTLVLTVTMTSLLASGVRADTFAYIANADSNDISVFRIEPSNGKAEAVETVAFPGVENPGSSTPLTLSPDRLTLFAGVRAQPYTVLSFAIDPRSGHLTYRGSGPLADSMANIATDRTGKFLFSASYGGNKVALNPIGADAIVQAAKDVIPTGLNAHAFLPSPDNHFVFATNLGSDQILSFRFDAATGALTPNEPAAIKVAEKNGPRHFVFHPNGKFVYLVNELSAALLVFAYDAAHGTWQQIQQASALPRGFDGKPFDGKPFDGKPWAADIHLTPDGRFLYASERGSSTLAAFKVDAESGKLTPLGSVPTEKQPRGFAIDPSGHVLAAVGELSNGMSVYTIDQASGALKLLQSYPVGKKPNWVEFAAFP
jgi:6-phosphogluconolactonase